MFGWPFLTLQKTLPLGVAGEDVNVPGSIVASMEHHIMAAAAQRPSQGTVTGKPITRLPLVQAAMIHFQIAKLYAQNVMS